MKIKLFEQFCNEHVAAVQNPQTEITTDDLLHFNGFNDRVLQGKKKEYIQHRIEDGDIVFSKRYDWKQMKEAKIEHDKMMTKFKYCYNAYEGHDSYMLVYSNIELPGCVQFDSKKEFAQ